MNSIPSSEVLIIGAGPAGLMLANILGMYGRSVTVLEARDELIDYPRGVGLDDESLRTIQTVGLVDTVLPHTAPQHIMRLVNGSGKTILVNNPQTQEFGWDRKHAFIQPEVDKALYEGLSPVPQHQRALRPPGRGRHRGRRSASPPSRASPPPTAPKQSADFPRSTWWAARAASPRPASAWA